MKVEQLYLELQKAIEESPVIPPCQVTDPEMWFGTEDESIRFKAAKQLCTTCPAIQACANYALAANEQFGVWGGLSPMERDKLLSRRIKGRPTAKVA